MANQPEMGQAHAAAQIAAQRRASVLPNPLGFSNTRQKRQGLNLSSNKTVQEILGKAGAPEILAELEEDCKPDHTADAIDELDQLANDLESSSGGSDEEEKDG